MRCYSLGVEDKQSASKFDGVVGRVGKERPAAAPLPKCAQINTYVHICVCSHRLNPTVLVARWADSDGEKITIITALYLYNAPYHPWYILWYSRKKHKKQHPKILEKREMRYLYRAIYRYILIMWYIWTLCEVRRRLLFRLNATLLKGDSAQALLKHWANRRTAGTFSLSLYQHKLRMYLVHIDVPCEQLCTKPDRSIGLVS